MDKFEFDKDYASCNYLHVQCNSDINNNNGDGNRTHIVFDNCASRFTITLKYKDRTYTFESDDGLSISLDLLGYTESLTFACACNDLSEFLKNKCKESGEKDIILCGAYDNNTGEGKEIILDN